MQTIQRKKQPAPLRRRILLLGAALMLLVALALVIPALEEPEPVSASPTEDTTLTVFECDMSELASITIQRRNDPVWTALPSANSHVTFPDADAFTLDWAECTDFLRAASRITAEDVLSDAPTDYLDHLADYGLARPSYIATIICTDGMEVTLRVGDKGPDGVWRYMLIDGDDRLFTFSNGSVDGLFVNRDTLRKVIQPTLHKSRINRITLTGAEGVQAQWTLNGHITDADAVDKWSIVHPFVYPADSTAMQALLANIADIHLGAYVCPATPETLTAYGFDAPRLTIDIHMAVGTIAATNTDGAAEPVDWPASTLTFVVGGEKSDMVDYILCGEHIYLSSHFTVGMFINYDVKATMSRYPVMTALGNLAKLSIQQDGQFSEYVLTRTEQVAENNELITDAGGNPVYTITVACNGTALDYAAFESAYNALTLVKVSGTLPSHEMVSAEPHTIYTFTDVDGTVHTVELATFDALHDAVSVDGHQAFYLIKGGFALHME